MYENAEDTSGEVCSKCGTWIDHWRNLKKSKSPIQCQRVGCGAEATDGAHVKDLKGNVMIIPLCRTCNLAKGKFNLKDESLLVSSGSC